MRDNNHVPYVADGDLASSARDHPRNGYAETRMIFPLQEGMPFPRTDVVFEVSPNLADVFDRPRVNPGPEVAASDLLPISPDWRAAVCMMRIIARPPSKPARSLDDDTLILADEVWRQPRHKENRERVIKAVKKKDASRFYAEIAARWSMTLGCDHCRRDAIQRTAMSAINTIDAFAEAQTVATGIPPAPLPGHLFHDAQAVWFREHNLDGTLHKDHGVSETGYIDPRSYLVPDPRKKDSSGKVDAPAFGDALTNHVAEVLLTLTHAHDIAPYYAFMAAATKSLYVEGNESTSILLAAQACESLLDLTLLHMLWWDREDSATAGTVLSDGVVKRVKSHYTRMGGNWDLTSCEPLQDWRKRVADKRNRVAHGGRRATFNEAAAALQAARKLHEHLIHVANQERARRIYPALVGILRWSLSDVTRRQREAFTYYMSDHTRPYQAFRYYKAIANRERWKANGNPIVPSDEHAETLATVRAPSDDIDWWLYDPETHHVIEAVPPAQDPVALPLFLTSYRRQIRPSLQEDTFHVVSDHPLTPVPNKEWRDAIEELPQLSPVRP